MQNHTSMGKRTRGSVIRQPLPSLRHLFCAGSINRSMRLLINRVSAVCVNADRCICFPSLQVADRMQVHNRFDVPLRCLVRSRMRRCFPNMMGRECCLHRRLPSVCLLDCGMLLPRIRWGLVMIQLLMEIAGRMLSCLQPPFDTNNAPSGK